MTDEFAGYAAPIAKALRRAKDVGIRVRIVELENHDVASVGGELVHIADMPRMVEEEIARR